MVTVSAEQLKRISIAIFKGAGCSDYEAERVSELLVLANLRGHDSHGVGLIPGYVNDIRSGSTKLGAKIEVVKETPVTALINGNFGLGQVVATRAMEIAIEKAKKNGVGIASIYNCKHIARLTDYAAMALEHGMIGFVTANVGPAGPGRPQGDQNVVPPYGGARGVFGTNPLCYAIPAGEEPPIIFDMATSIWPTGKVRVANARDEKVPEGILLDGQGRPTTDTKAYYGPPRGVILPFGGIAAHKGYGLCLVVDLLSGALSGYGCALRSHTNGVFMMALDVACFRPVEEFKADVDEVIQECRATPPAQGFVGPHGEREVLVPGDPERRAEERNRREGIYVEDTTWNLVTKAAKDVGVDIEKVEL